MEEPVTQRPTTPRNLESASPSATEDRGPNMQKTNDAQHDARHSKQATSEAANTTNLETIESVKHAGGTGSEYQPSRHLETYRQEDETIEAEDQQEPSDGSASAEIGHTIAVDACTYGYNENGIIPCDRSRSTCVPGIDILSYKCNCLPGYMRRREPTPTEYENGSMNVCADIDECHVPNMHECQDRCSNGLAPPGDYTCDCFADRFLVGKRLCKSCVYSAWSEYGVCEGTCGTGIQRRERLPLGESIEHPECDSVRQEAECLLPVCQECAYSLWSVWGKCEGTCEAAFQVKTRKLTAGNPESCDLPLIATRSCQLPQSICNTQEDKQQLVKYIISASGGVVLLAFTLLLVITRRARTHATEVL